MKKIIFVLLLLLLLLTSCEKASIGKIGGADGPTAIIVSQRQ